MKPTTTPLLLAALGALFIPIAARASSHMDAPLITLDPAANTTDVYAFVSTIGGVKYLTTALAVYPFEEPGIGPNKYNFDDKVIYTINLAAGANLAAGRPTLAYEFRFRTRFKNQNTIAQSYLGVVEAVDDPAQNLTQQYVVTKVAPKRTTLLTGALVPPNNQGLVTKYYNQGDSGENPAREGVSDPNALDRYTSSTIYTTPQGYKIFAGQRDDGLLRRHPEHLRSRLRLYRPEQALRQSGRLQRPHHRAQYSDHGNPRRRPAKRRRLVHHQS